MPGAREAIEAVGARLLYLPPYSPDFNPIEQLFAKLKALLRKAAERSVEGLWNRIAALLHAFTPEECANYFRNAGYASREVETALGGSSKHPAGGADVSHSMDRPLFRRLAVAFSGARADTRQQVPFG
jgi:hypothetical protein